jgi:hypothetical protein
MAKKRGTEENSMSHDDATVAIDRQKWELIKNIIQMLFAQQSLLGSLVIVSGAHGKILRELAVRLDYAVPEEAALPDEVDPETVRRMNQGLLELEKLIFNEDPPQGPGA